MEIDIKEEVKNNNDYLIVLHTTKQSQITAMCLIKNEDIPEETHEDTTQIIQIVSGKGIAKIGNIEYDLSAGTMLIIPPNKKHYVCNIGSSPLKLYSIYSPPEHPKNRHYIRQAE